MVRRPPSPCSNATMQPNTYLPDHVAPSVQNTLSETEELLMKLHKLHADEFVYLGQRISDSDYRCYTSRVCRLVKTLKQYVYFTISTWVKALWELIFHPFNIMDHISIICMSMMTCIIITIILPWCIFCHMPLVKHVYDLVSRKYFNGFCLVNSFYPSIFSDLSEKQIRAARTFLSQPIEESKSRLTRRIFNLDASKVLLQCASLMYERTSHTVYEAAKAYSNPTQPLPHETQLPTRNTYRLERHLSHVIDKDAYSSVLEALHGQEDTEEQRIRFLSESELGLQYSTVSEMNSIGGPVCGLFWDPSESFIILAFKGTTPSDFSEWATDFTFQMRESGTWLRGFRRVHSGFLNKVFPSKIPAGSKTPYETIISCMNTVAKKLREKNPERKVNLWITGHSLGCALASLVYSRLILEVHEHVPDVVIRDAYLFAAPVLCDVESACVFNGKMNKHYNTPRTMWRITNGGDAVATCLPEAGDNLEWDFSPWNLFSYSHLGCEIKLRSAPKRCLVRGFHVTPGSQVTIESAIHYDAIPDGSRFAENSGSDSDGVVYSGLKKIKELENRGIPKAEIMLDTLLFTLQNLPIVGRILAHGPGFYWASLQAVAPGDCEWIDN